MATLTSDTTEIIIRPEVINPAYLPYIQDETQTQILYGGSASGKSYFLAERAVMDVLGGERNYLICRKVGKYVTKSVWAEIENIIKDWGLEELFIFNKSERVITCVNKKQFIFTGLDEPQKLKSIRAADGAITDIWIEEATEADKSDIKELEKRQRGGDNKTPKRLILSFNPIMQNHWLYKEYFEQIGWTDDQISYRAHGLSILKTTYKDNRFLTDQDRARLENETDPYYHAVYTLGNWGVLGNVIFTNWEMRDLSGMRDQFTERRAGLDFGFADDPAALVSTHYDRMRKEIYVYNELYETDLTNDILASRVTSIIGNDYVICDSAEPKSIAELRKYDVSARAAKKGKDSVTFGIDWLKQHRIIIDVTCLNMRNELQTYKWKEDAGGHALKIPVDRNNHLIDALRYAYEDDQNDVSANSSWTAELGTVEDFKSPWA